MIEGEPQASVTLSGAIYRFYTCLIAMRSGR
jgi:hypothetical protein